MFSESAMFASLLAYCCDLVERVKVVGESGDCNNVVRMSQMP